MADKNIGRAIAVAAYTMVVGIMLTVLAGCSIHGPMDRPYDPDPSRGETLFDQIPNWEGEARKVCAGHIPPSQRKPHQTGRC